MLAIASFYRGVLRWSLWYDNPNVAAVLLALATLALFHLGIRAWTRRRFLDYVLVGLSFVTGYALLHTFSRGGILAFALGMMVLLTDVLWMRSGRKVLAACLGLLAFILCSSVYLGTAARCVGTSVVRDGSVVNRLAIWRNAPRMIADAPGGWGLGRSAAAFREWYQPLSVNDRYDSLVSSHLTWLVEFGRGGRFLYILGWMLAIVLGGLHWRRRNPLPLAVWIAFGTAASFSTVLDRWELWVLPLALLIRRVRIERWRVVFPILCLLAGLAVFAIELLGRVLTPTGTDGIRCLERGRHVVIGEGEPAVWVVRDEVSMGGEACGRDLRACGCPRPTAVVDSLALVPDTAETLVVGCAASSHLDELRRFARLRRLMVLSPTGDVDWRRYVVPSAKVSVCHGELSSNCPDDESSECLILPGMGEYIPIWPRLVEEKSR